MFPRGPAIELIDPDLLPAQVVRVPRVVLDVEPEISRALLGLLQRFDSGGNRERPNTEREKDGWLDDINRC